MALTKVVLDVGKQVEKVAVVVVAVVAAMDLGALSAGLSAAMLPLSPSLAVLTLLPGL